MPTAPRPIAHGTVTHGNSAMDHTDAATADRELILTRVLDAPRELVFRMWTDPRHVAQWWGPQGFTTISLEMDPSPGGAYRGSMRSPEGTLDSRRGVYREIVPPERQIGSAAG